MPTKGHYLHPQNGFHTCLHTLTWCSEMLNYIQSKSVHYHGWERIYYRNSTTFQGPLSSHRWEGQVQLMEASTNVVRQGEGSRGRSVLHKVCTGVVGRPGQAGTVPRQLGAGPPLPSHPHPGHVQRSPPPLSAQSPRPIKYSNSLHAWCQWS